MRQPQVFSAKELKEWVGDEQPWPGVWRPARPMPFQVPWWSPPFLITRIKIAWKVLIGRYDAVNWEYPIGCYILTCQRCHRTFAGNLPHGGNPCDVPLEPAPVKSP